MKIVVIDGPDLIGSMLVAKLIEDGQDAVLASAASGVNILTGEGLAAAVRNAWVVVDLSNPQSIDDASVIDFFTTSTLNLLAEETAAGVLHHVALSVVGTKRLPESRYFRGRIAQEDLIKLSSRPYTVVQATQFFDSVEDISALNTNGHEVRLAPALVQPVSREDVVATLAEVSQGPPRNGVVEVAGPEQFHLEEFIRHGLLARDDPRVVVADPEALYLGAHLRERTLLPGEGAHQGETRFRDWLAEPVDECSTETATQNSSGPMLRVV